MEKTEIWVNRRDFRNTIVKTAVMPEVKNSEIRVAIDKFALTSNNVSYAVSGDMIGYWQFFPVETLARGEWGKVPVWGIADVLESQCRDVKVGERLYGFFPMATHLTLRPGHVTQSSFVDVAEHRIALPALYNRYARTAVEAAFIQKLENERCLLFPLFATSFVLADYLKDNEYFGAQQIVIGSVSSKTGFGLAAFLKSIAGFKGRIIGLTSSGNKAFVEALNDCDRVVTYGNEDAIDATKTSVYVDMSGNGALRATLHRLLEDNMAKSISVGATHWDARRSDTDLPSAEFFFAPTQIAKREADWGPGVLFEKAYAASAELSTRIKSQITMEFVKGAQATRQIWCDMLDNKVLPNRAIMVSLS